MFQCPEGHWGYFHPLTAKNGLYRRYWVSVPRRALGVFPQPQRLWGKEEWCVGVSVPRRALGVFPRALDGLEMSARPMSAFQCPEGHWGYFHVGLSVAMLLGILKRFSAPKGIGGISTPHPVAEADFPPKRLTPQPAFHTSDGLPRPFISPCRLFERRILSENRPLARFFVRSRRGPPRNLPGVPLFPDKSPKPVRRQPRMATFYHPQKADSPPTAAPAGPPAPSRGRFSRARRGDPLLPDSLGNGIARPQPLHTTTTTRE